MGKWWTSPGVTLQLLKVKVSAGQLKLTSKQHLVSMATNKIDVTDCKTGEFLGNSCCFTVLSHKQRSLGDTADFRCLADTVHWKRDKLPRVGRKLWPSFLHLNNSKKVHPVAPQWNPVVATRDQREQRPHVALRKQAIKYYVNILIRRLPGLITSPEQKKNIMGWKDDRTKNYIPEHLHLQR